MAIVPDSEITQQSHFEETYTLSAEIYIACDWMLAITVFGQDDAMAEHISLHSLCMS